MKALLDDHGQSQGNCGVWSNFSLPEFTNRSTRNREAVKLQQGRGETLKHDSETYLGKLPFFTYGARET